MTLVSTADLMHDAVSAGTGVAAFNVIHLETAEAFVLAAEITGLPVVLQISQNCARYHGALQPIALATLSAARASSARVAVHLDHADEEELTHQAVDLGFGSVMFDGAALDYDENVETTARVVAYAHAHGVYVEAELGEIGGKDGAHAPGVLTDPEEAQRFVFDTGVDALAVAVGSSHAMTERLATVNLELIARLRSTLAVPLVLHGSSGLSDEEIQRSIAAGMTKINVSTHLNAVLTGAVRACLRDNPAMVDSRAYFSAARRSLATEAARMITLLSTPYPQGQR